MTVTLAPTRPEAGAGRTTFFTLAAREMHRFVVNPVFLAGVVLTALAVWNNGHTGVTEIDTVNPYPAIFLGGFGMMATFWQTRSMRDSEPVVGVTPTTLPMRTGALCSVAIVPFLCGVLSLIAFRFYQAVVGDWVYGAFSPPASPCSSRKWSCRRSAGHCWGSRWAAGSGSRARRSCCSWSCTAG